MLSFNISLQTRLRLALRPLWRIRTGEYSEKGWFT